MQKLLLPAVLAVSLMGVSGASALPLSPSPQIDTGVIQVQHRHHHQPPRYHKHRQKHHHYRAGHRYKTAPKGWRRHAARPGDWQRRGCVLVGPVWFCP